MAVEFLLKDEDEENQNKATSDLSGGEGIGGAPALGTGKVDSPDQKGTASGSYTNLQKYVEANKGRDFGGQFAGKINEGTQEGLNNLSQRESEFKSSVDQGSLKPLGQDLKDKISSAPQSLSEGEKDQVKSLRTGSYSGLEDFQGSTDENDPYTKLRKQFSDLEDENKSLGSSSGASGLLNKYYGRPTYTQGEKALDSFILGNQMEPVNKAKQSLSDAIDKYGQKKSELNEYAQKAKGMSSDAKDEYRRLLGLDDSGSALPYEKGKEASGLIQKDLERLYKQADDRQRSAQGRLTGAQLAGQPGLFAPDEFGNGNRVYDLRNEGTKNYYQNLGGLDKLYGADPRSYLSSVPMNDINYQRTASPQDLARLQALTDLAGVDQSYLDPSLVGTLDDESLVNFDLNKFVQDVNQRKGEYEAGLAAPVELKEGAFKGGLDDVLSRAESQYNRARDLYDMVYANNNPNQSNAQYLKNNVISPYEALKKQREDLRNKYGYYDLVRR